MGQYHCHVVRKQAGGGPRTAVGQLQGKLAKPTGTFTWQTGSSHASNTIGLGVDAFRLQTLKVGVLNLTSSTRVVLRVR